MGQCLGTSSSRTPSALKLCQAYERQSHDELERTTGIVDPGHLAVLAEPGGSIWQHMAPDEVRAVGEIVSTWAQRLINGQDARRQLQMRVLRGHTPASLNVLLPRNNTSGQNNPGPSPRSRGSNPTAATMRRNGASAEDEPQPVAPPTSSPGPGFHAATPQPNPSGHEQEVQALAAAVHNPGEAAVFGGQGLGLFAGLTSALGGTTWNGHQVHEIFPTINSVFSVHIFEDARILAMQELGLEGSRALPEEVRAAFLCRVNEILQAASNPQRVSVPWLDLVRLCLFVEVVRHIRTSSSTSSTSRMNSPIGTELPPMSMPLTASPLALARVGPRGLEGAHLGGATNMNIIFVTGLPDGRGGGGLSGIGISGINGNMDAPFRMSPDVLHERVGLLLGLVLGVDGQDARPVGLSIEEMDQHCPVGNREGADGGCCPICLEPEIAGEPVRKLPCSHAFHPSCCEAWLSTADTCPACRFQIRRGGE